ncbi:hypothetical protein [Spirosoma areae]
MLSGLPCPDTDCCRAEKNHPINPSASADDEHGHKAPCSPFCSCATCAGFAVPQPFRYALPAEPVGVISAPKAFAYQSSGYGDIARSVWQPPKV